MPNSPNDPLHANWMYVSDLGRVEGDCIFSREDFFPFRSSPSSSHVTLRRNNLVDPSYKTICQTNPRPKFSMNQRTIYIVAKFQNPKNSNPCDNNNLFSRREGEKKEEKKNSNEETICVQWLENWKQSTGTSSFPGDYPRGWNEEKVDTGVARIKSAAFPSAHRSRARLIAARVGDYARGSVV